MFFSVQKGTFVPGSVYTISIALESLLAQGILCSGQTFLDAGSGDGRIIALASVLGFQAYGIEYNDDVYNSSLLNIESLSQHNILKSNLKIVLGDFLDPDPYSKLGVPFSSFDIIYNYATFPDALANKIAFESKVNTIFLLHTVNNIPPIYNNLILDQSYKLHEVNQFLHIYKK